MIKVYGKGDTVSSSEYWDGRTTYNAINQFYENKKEDVAIRNILIDSLDTFSLLEGSNKLNFLAGGVVEGSFNDSDFIPLSSDLTSITLGTVTRQYVRCTPGIAFKDGYAYINKPAVELACSELREILELELEEESIEIKFNYDNLTFKCKIKKIIDEHIKIFEFTNNTDFEDDSTPGYNTGVEMLGAIASDETLSEFIFNSIGDDLTKIDLELTEKITSDGVYAWEMRSDGLIYLVDNASVVGLQLNKFEIASGILTKDPVFSPTPFGSSQAVGGDLAVQNDLTVGGNLTVNGTQIIANTETVLIKDNILVINNNEVGDGVTAGTAGIEVDRGTLTNYQFIFDETSDVFKVGEVGGLQVVATREDSPNDTSVPFWNDTNKKFETSSNLTFNGTNLSVTESIEISKADGNAELTLQSNSSTASSSIIDMHGWRSTTSNDVGLIKIFNDYTSTTTAVGEIRLHGNGDVEHTNDVYANAFYGNDSSNGPVYKANGNYAELSTRDRSQYGILIGKESYGYILLNALSGKYVGFRVNSAQTGYCNSTGVYGAVGNDYADNIEIDNKIDFEYGYCYIRGKDGLTRKSNRYAEKGIIGITTNTATFHAVSYDQERNEDEENADRIDYDYLPISVSGFVLAHTDKIYSSGTPLTSSKEGKLTKANIFIKLFYPERIVGTYYKTMNKEEWNNVEVNNRNLVRVK